jgi:hypothetical protein
MSVLAEHVIAVRVRGRGEMVDARDLKSLGSNFPCRFKSGRPHQIRTPLQWFKEVPRSESIVIRRVGQ